MGESFSKFFIVAWITFELNRLFWSIFAWLFEMAIEVANQSGQTVPQKQYQRDLWLKRGKQLSLAHTIESPRNRRFLGAVGARRLVK